MKIIISPAKKMNVDTDSLPWEQLPQFLEKTQELHSKLKSMSPQDLQKLWKCNDKITAENVERLQFHQLTKNLTPAILAYEGIQYQYMAPSVFSDEEFDYIQKHLRILSGFYGILKPFDGVIPYRLEMQAKLKMGNHKDLYAFWGSALADALCEEEDCIVNLASKEYSSCISKHLKEGVTMVNCLFAELDNGKLIEKGTMCKMARGEMVRFMAEHKVQNIEEMKAFDGRNHRYAAEYSTDEQLVFLKKSQ